MVAEHGSPAVVLRALDGGTQKLSGAVAIEDVVPQYERVRIAGYPLLTNDERLCKTVRRGLLGGGKRSPELRAVAQKVLEVLRVIGRRYERMSRMPAVQS